MSEPIYSDLDLNFQRHPVTSDVVVKTNEEAIKNSVKNLILLNTYEKPFRPEIGSDVRDLLFEPATPLTAIRLKDAIIEVITNFEPRVKIEDVFVSVDIDNNTFNTTIVFSVIKNNSTLSLDLSLERLR